MPEAARVGDQVSHLPAFAAPLAGALVGAVIGAAATMAGQGPGSPPMAPGGPIVTGANTVFIGSTVRQAAVGGGALGSKVACLQHKISMVVQGSATVFIEGMPAARRGDRGACAFVIAEGCSTVIIGG